MKELILAGLIMALGLDPSLGFAQTSGSGASGRRTTRQCRTQSLREQQCDDTQHAPSVREPNDHAPVPEAYTGGSPMPSTITRWRASTLIAQIEGQTKIRRA
jgi:hypothetical protein